MIEESIKNILLEIESDAALDGNGELREGLKNTPKRVVESWKEIYSGSVSYTHLTLPTKA